MSTNLHKMLDRVELDRPLLFREKIETLWDGHGTTASNYETSYQQHSIMTDRSHIPNPANKSLSLSPD